jgi:GNAT superfamily N-acetyltransferase
LQGPEGRTITIRAARPEDAGGYLKLVEALAHYESLPPPDSEAKTRLIDHLFRDRPLYRLLVAIDRDQVVGYAVHFLTYSTFLAKPTLYLEDTFVLPDYRSCGLGHRLFVMVARTALAEGCGRVDFQVPAWNQVALAFYSQHGVACKRDWLLHRIEGDDLERVAGMD